MFLAKKKDRKRRRRRGEERRERGRSEGEGNKTRLEAQPGSCRGVVNRAQMGSLASGSFKSEQGQLPSPHWCLEM